MVSKDSTYELCLNADFDSKMILITNFGDNSIIGVGFNTTLMPHYIAEVISAIKLCAGITIAIVFAAFFLLFLTIPST